MNNYEISLQAAMKRFCSYDMNILSAKDGVKDGGQYLQTQFLGLDTTVSKTTGQVAVDGQPADFGEALSVFDWLCDRKIDAVASNEFCPVSSLSGVYVRGSGLSMHMPTLSKRIHEDPARFHAVMADMGAHKLDLGDIGYRLQIFPDLPMCLKFYFGDDEFSPVLNLLWDKNSLQFVRYETLYYIAGCLHKHLQRLI